MTFTHRNSMSSLPHKIVDPHKCQIHGWLGTILHSKYGYNLQHGKASGGSLLLCKLAMASYTVGDECLMSSADSADLGYQELARDQCCHIESKGTFQSGKGTHQPVGRNNCVWPFFYCAMGWKAEHPWPEGGVMSARRKKQWYAARSWKAQQLKLVTAQS